VSGSDDSSFYRPLKNSDITKDLFTEAGRNKGDAVSSFRQRVFLVIVFPLFAQLSGQWGSWCKRKPPAAEHLMTRTETEAQASIEEQSWRQRVRIQEKPNPG